MIISRHAEALKQELLAQNELNGAIFKITDFDEIVKLDTNYIDQWSLWLDCKILGKTFIVIWSGN